MAVAATGAGGTVVDGVGGVVVAGALISIVWTGVWTGVWAGGMVGFGAIKAVATGVAGDVATAGWSSAVAG